jgi:glutamate-ammonia-ligase adenylyltransferase
MAAEVMDLLSKRTEDGIVFQTDSRLRPDGEKGLLVNTPGAYEEYYRQRAGLWEIQSLTRRRAVAGNAETGGAFQKMAAELTDFRAGGVRREETSNFKLQTPGKLQAPNIKTAKVQRKIASGAAVDSEERRADAERSRKSEGLPAAYTPRWKEEIHRMRMRIEKERTPAGKDDLAIKTGKGGLMDAEFVAQALCMENGWQEANTLRALERARNLKLEALNFREASKSNLSETVQSPKSKVQSQLSRRSVVSGLEDLIEGYRKLRRVEGILRRWSYEGETVLPDDPAPYYRVAVRCGFETTKEFRKAVAEWRAQIREGYEVMFGFRWS